MIAGFQFQCRCRRAFTLIELMVVISIIIVISSLVVPTVHSTLDGGKITQATNQVMGAISFAAEKAATENRTITVRLIAGPDGEYRFLQLVEIAPDGATGLALDRAVALPDSVAIARNMELTSFFKPDPTPATASDPRISSFGTNYNFLEIKFRPGGRMSGDPATFNINNPCFLTVVSSKRDTSLSTPPPNFATIQIDPVNARLTVYRP